MTTFDTFRGSPFAWRGYFELTLPVDKAGSDLRPAEMTLTPDVSNSNFLVKSDSWCNNYLSNCNVLQSYTDWTEPLTIFNLRNDPSLER